MPPPDGCRLEPAGKAGGRAKLAGWCGLTCSAADTPVAFIRGCVGEPPKRSFIHPRGYAMFKFAIPVLHATSSAAAKSFTVTVSVLGELLRIDRLVVPIPVTWV